ncbi:SGNH/GDSL hydrolase family protein [Lutimonas zeaxanthinifaciens]|uniref:SGNH/GDSL hydrolase family protein n=1 Tax=Lutimonas zeaxanthinifaciens TaxID=3060215 RepID=UPI00265D0A6D|nr:SGNH/GDSL hydrolase family protein [Lutimonas sp. YSD2104]WKK67559.1 SGNH/GDSL hydrolase family protein [Lutimonas sp. YSD2104]
MNPPSTENTFTFLALGDSYTIGQGVSEEMRWPNQLKDRLLKESITLNKVHIIAQTGWTTSALLNAIDQKKPGQYDMVSLLIGVNNQYQRKPFEEFKEEFIELLDIALNLSGESQRVFVVSIPDYGVTRYGSANPGGIASEINNYNGFIKMHCEENKVPFVDVTEISRTLADSEGALASDALHPSGYQYSLWVEEIIPVVLELLEQ